MKNGERVYIAIDLKSFFASVECVERGLNPLTTHLVVADSSRTEKTICLAVTPPLKSYGIAGRARLFEVVHRVKEVNQARMKANGMRAFTGSSSQVGELASSPTLSLDYIIAPPRMAYYIDYSTRIYNVYLKYVAAEDIHVYSIDEVFMDITSYISLRHITAHEFAKLIIKDVLSTTGITATAGIGTNLYLCKVAMDIMAKRTPPDEDGVRIAYLDEMSYREQLWEHRPLTDFWRVGHGIATRLSQYGMHTMGDVARYSLSNEDFFYKLFGVNAELLIDHAWGHETSTMEAIKAYRPSVNSLSRGQVLQEAYDSKKARVVAREMVEALALELLDKKLLTDQISLTIGYDVENLSRPEVYDNYKGMVVEDHYGRKIPKPSHATHTMKFPTSSARLLNEAIVGLYDGIVNKDLLIRRLNVTLGRVVSEDKIKAPEKVIQADLFTDVDALIKEESELKQRLEKERQVQNAILDIKKKYGKNAVLKGLNYDEGATAKTRNKTIGGHKA